MNTQLMLMAVMFGVLLATAVGGWIWGRVQLAKGRRDLQAEIDRASAENLRKRTARDDEIAELSPDDLRRRAGEWVSDDRRSL